MIMDRNTAAIEVDGLPSLLPFFKALSDATRLRIAGRLAAEDCSAEELAQWLDEKPAVVKHHLGRLAEAGLVDGPAAPGQTYRLRMDHVRALAARLLAHEVTPVPAGAAADDFEHKVLREFLAPDGAIREFPVQDRKLRVIVRYALQAFEPGQRYSEKEVNARLKRYHPDSAALRRALVDFGLLQRQPTGREYWRADAILAA